MQFPALCRTAQPYCWDCNVADAVESWPNRIACETAPSALAARSSPRAYRHAHVGDFAHSLTLRTYRHFAWVRWYAWVRHFVRGSDGMRGRRSGAYLKGWRACHGVNAHCRRFACERERRWSGAVVLATQITLPATRHYRRLWSRWFVLVGATLPRSVTLPSRTVTSTAIKWVELRYTEIPCVTCLAMTASSMGGIAPARGATRRRHAEGGF